MDYRLKDPNDLTPEERLRRLVELLAAACVRLVEQRTAEKGCSRGRKKVPDSGKIPLDSV